MLHAGCTPACEGAAGDRLGRVCVGAAVGEARDWRQGESQVTRGNEVNDAAETTPHCAPFAGARRPAVRCGGVGVDDNKPQPINHIPMHLAHLRPRLWRRRARPNTISPMHRPWPTTLLSSVGVSCAVLVPIWKEVYRSRICVRNTVFNHGLKEQHNLCLQIQHTP